MVYVNLLRQLVIEHLLARHLKSDYQRGLGAIRLLLEILQQLHKHRVNATIQKTTYDKEEPLRLFTFGLTDSHGHLLLSAILASMMNW